MSESKTTNSMLIDTDFGRGAPGRNNSLLVATPEYLIRVSGLFVLQVDAILHALQECGADPSSSRLDAWKKADDEIRFDIVPLSDISRVVFTPANNTFKVCLGTPSQGRWVHLSEPQFDKNRLWDFLRANLQFEETQGPAPTMEALFGSPIMLSAATIGTFFGLFFLEVLDHRNRCRHMRV